MSQSEPVGNWLELVLKMAAVGGIFSGICIAFWKWLRRAINAFVAADSLAGIFGSQAGHELQRLLTLISRSDGEQQLRQRIIESHLQIGVYECGLDGQCLWSNPFLAELFGLDERQTHGYGWISGIAEDERLGVQKRWRESVELGLPYEDEYTVENRRTGVRVHCKTRAQLMKLDGEPMCYMGWVIPE